MSTTQTPVESQWAIVVRQFRKQRSAVWGLRIAAGLVLLAVYAPLIASSQPFTWKAPGGETTHPWFTKLFDQKAWEQPLDRLFNLLMVAFTLWLVIRLVLWIVARFSSPEIRAGMPRTKRRVRWGLLGVTAFVALGQLFFGWFLTSEPTVDYRAPDKVVKAAEDVLWATDAWLALEAGSVEAEALALPIEAEVLRARERLLDLDSAFAYRLETELAEIQRERAVTPDAWQKTLEARVARLGGPDALRESVAVLHADLLEALARPNLAFDEPARFLRETWLATVPLGVEGTAYRDVLDQAWTELVPLAAEWLEAVNGRRERLRIPTREDAEAALAAATEERAAYTIVRTPVPYGYRDQLSSTADKFRGFLDFERGEAHLLGTDITGRDIFARILFGTRISLTIGLVAVSIYITIGTIFGALAGYFFNRMPDLVIMRFVEVMICIPQFFLLLTIVALFDAKSVFMIMFAIGLVSWTGVTRLVRGEFIRERNIEYVTAARAMGFRSPRILFRHILPNAMGPVLVAATFGVASAILTESGLSFLGMGDPTVPSWGAILNHGRENEYWHLILPPSVAIFITVTALNLVGDGLRDALDPKLRD